MKWEKRILPMYKDLQELERKNAHLVPTRFTWSKWQWAAAEGFSIISPSTITMNMYELYDGEDIYRFKTLKEAKAHAERLYYNSVPPDRPAFHLDDELIEAAKKAAQAFEEEEKE